MSRELTFTSKEFTTQSISEHIFYRSDGISNKPSSWLKIDGVLSDLARVFAHRT